jgi:hypothetical protein
MADYEKRSLVFGSVCQRLWIDLEEGVSRLCLHHEIGVGEGFHQGGNGWTRLGAKSSQRGRSAEPDREVGILKTGYQSWHNKGGFESQNSQSVQGVPNHNLIVVLETPDKSRHSRAGFTIEFHQGSCRSLPEVRSRVSEGLRQRRHHKFGFEFEATQSLGGKPSSFRILVLETLDEKRQRRTRIGSEIAHHVNSVGWDCLLVVGQRRQQQRNTRLAQACQGKHGPTRKVGHFGVGYQSAKICGGWACLRPECVIGPDGSNRKELISTHQGKHLIAFEPIWKSPEHSEQPCPPRWAFVLDPLQKIRERCDTEVPDGFGSPLAFGRGRGGIHLAFHPEGLSIRYKPLAQASSAVSRLTRSRECVDQSGAHRPANQEEKKPSAPTH